MIELRDVSKSFGKKVILNNINYNFDSTSTIYTILGESGSGKTTLLNILYGIENKYEGDYILCGKRIQRNSIKEWDKIRNKEIGIVFQDFKLLDQISVYDNLKYTYFLNPSNETQRINEVLDIVNLLDEKHQIVHTLSGGQKQRLAFARAILNEPKIILLDEPTGNLDNDNVEIIIDYINKIKKDKIVIIITHDDRLKDFSDVILKLEDKKLIEIKEINNTNRDCVREQKKEYFKPKLFKYFIKSIIPRFKELVFNNIPTIIIISIFICIFSIINITFNKQINNLYQGLSDKAIYISSSLYNDDYIQKNNTNKIVKSDDETRINFSNSDLEDVLNILNVEKATLYNSNLTSSYDNDEYQLNLYWNRDSLPNIIRESISFGSAPERIQFSFETLNIPSDYVEYYNNLEIIMGHFPTQESDEIIIPDILAYHLFDTIKESLNYNITFDVYDKKNNHIKKEYTIVGIYKTDFEYHLNNNYSLYVNYIEEDFLALFLNEDQYITMKNIDIDNNRFVQDYTNPIYNNYESYANAIGTNKGDMLVIVNEANNIKDVQIKLKELFPNLRILSQYEFEKGETADAFNKIKLSIYLGISIFCLILGCLIVFLNKNYIRTRNKELAILYAMGYKRSHIGVIIAMEYTIVMIVDLIIAFGILKLIQLSGFSASTVYELFIQVFNQNQIIQIFIFVFIMFLFSMLFSIYGINRRKLRNYLEGGTK